MIPFLIHSSRKLERVIPDPFEELHYITVTAGEDNLIIDGLKITSDNAGSQRTLEVSPPTNFNTPKKVYFEIEYHDSNINSNTRFGLYGGGLGNWAFSTFANGLTYVGATASSTTPSSAYNSLSSMIYPVVRRFCWDSGADKMWNQICNADGSEMLNWNDNVTHDPVTGSGGYDTSGWYIGDGNLQIMSRIDVPSDISIVQINMHKSQFRFDIPDGFSEMIAPGEYT